ncbi:MAG: PilT/PilU family type 4a pilus ATPase [Gammaproteobacteria bacterium]|jgi:twitching motility protein PilU
MHIDSFLHAMVQRGASDLFITADSVPSLKIHGSLEKLDYDILLPEASRDLACSVMSRNQQVEFELTHESNFALQRPGLGRFRVNVFQHQNNIGMVLRRIETHIPTFEELQLPAMLAELSMAKRGLILMVGATAMGKSTTLAAMVGYRNRNSCGHIVCVEDPIEFVHQPDGCIITQREVGIDTESFEAALRNALRQAPDVILLGEIRTREAMELALAFAETGHLCLATLHAANAAQALDRVVHLFPRDRRDHLLLDLSLNLKAVLAQRLIPRMDGNGRRVALEVLFNTPLAADTIRRGDTHLLKDLMQRSTDVGMRTFDHAIYELYSQGEISYEEALLNAESANEVRLMVKLGKGVDPHEFADGMGHIGLERGEGEDLPITEHKKSNSLV